MLDTIRSKVEPAGLVHKFFGEQVPDGFFWVLLKAEQNNTWTRYAQRTYEPNQQVLPLNELYPTY